MCILQIACTIICEIVKNLIYLFVIIYAIVMGRFYINVFSPVTATSFEMSDKTVTGFSPSHRSYIYSQDISKGDVFICYCTKLKRFIGALEVVDGVYEDNTPLFVEDNDPFILRYKVRPIVWLSFDKAIPIHEDIIWNNLSFTRELPKGSTNWTHKVISSPKLLDDSDGKTLLNILVSQSKNNGEYSLSESDQQKINVSKIRIESGEEVAVSTPDDEAEVSRLEIVNANEQQQRESIKIQAKLAYIGEELGYKIWIPSSDRSRVLEEWHPKSTQTLLVELPIFFDTTTLKTIKNIDVLWIKRRTIVRAFEVEGTTSIYSGILRMADLLSLQPNIGIRIHIVASETRREAVFEQISRPVFTVMEKGALSEICSYISYNAVYEICNESKLKHMTDSILTDYEEWSRNN